MATLSSRHWRCWGQCLSLYSLVFSDPQGCVWGELRSGVLDVGWGGVLWLSQCLSLFCASEDGP